MRRYKKQDYDHTDESEVFKHKSLMASKNRKKMSRLTFVMLCLLAACVAAACLLSYVFNIV